MKEYRLRIGFNQVIDFRPCFECHPDTSSKRLYFVEHQMIQPCLTATNSHASHAIKRRKTSD
jgi:hypothetical protein